VRRYLLVPLALGAVGLWAFLDDENGIRRYLELRRELARSEQRIEERKAEVARLKSQAEALRTDPIAIEAAIREDLGLAKPGEVVVRIPGEGVGAGETPRLP